MKYSHVWGGNAHRGMGQRNSWVAGLKSIAFLPEMRHSQRSWSSLHNVRSHQKRLLIRERRGQRKWAAGTISCKRAIQTHWPSSWVNGRWLGQASWTLRQSAYWGNKGLDSISTTLRCGWTCECKRGGRGASASLVADLCREEKRGDGVLLVVDLGAGAGPLMP